MMKDEEVRVATFEEFKKIEMRVAKILEVTEHPNADRLYVLRIDLGGRIKQVVAGIRDFYKKEDLVGRLVIAVDNLDPVVLRGVESQGMVLATKDDKTLAVLAPDRGVTVGSLVT